MIICVNFLYIFNLFYIILKLLYNKYIYIFYKTYKKQLQIIIHLFKLYHG